MIRIISCGVNQAPPPAADVMVDCSVLPDPSQQVQDLDGRNPAVGQVICALNPAAHLVAGMAGALCAHASDGFTLVCVCRAGWHRSVWVSEQAARAARAAGREVELIHRDLKEAT